MLRSFDAPCGGERPACTNAAARCGCAGKGREFVVNTFARKATLYLLYTYDHDHFKKFITAVMVVHSYGVS
jgi:hypothetical protein